MSAEIIEFDPAEREADRLRAIYGPLADLVCQAALESETATPRQRAEVIRIRLALNQHRSGVAGRARRHG
jgi:hypothetical protein